MRAACAVLTVDLLAAAMCGDELAAADLLAVAVLEAVERPAVAVLAVVERPAFAAKRPAVAACGVVWAASLLVGEV